MFITMQTFFTLGINLKNTRGTCPESNKIYNFLRQGTTDQIWQPLRKHTYVTLTPLNLNFI